MATYVNDLRLKEIATGDEAGTWGTSTNTNLELIGEALGYGTQDCFASDADATTTVADGATDPARAMYFKVTSSATLTATRTLTIAPNTISRVMLIENATTGSQSIAISQGSGGNVTIASGQVKMVYLDGAGATAAVVDALADLELGTITVSDLTATTADINGGTIDGATLGGSSQVTITDADMNGGTIDGVVIGGASAAAGTFTTLQADTSLNVDGTVTADGLTVDGDVAISAANSRLRLFETDTTDLNTQLQTSAGDFNISTLADDAGSSSLRLKIDHATGDLSLYENTGTTPKFFWDASAEALGIGTTSPSGILHLSAGNPTAYFTSADTGSIYLYFGGTTSPTKGLIRYSDNADFFSFNTDSAEAMRITSAGNVGIGTSSPDTELHISTSAQVPILRVETTHVGGVPLFELKGAGSSQIKYVDEAGVNQARIDLRDGGEVRFNDTSSGSTVERMRIDASGNLLVGTTTAPNTLAGASATQGLAFNGGTGYLVAAASGTATAYFNRQTSDGTILDFRKDGSTVGSIGAQNGQPYFALDNGSQDVGILLGDNTVTSRAIIPCRDGGTIPDGAIDIGYNSGRWRDLYLSGGVYLGGTGAANLLDDYETGTFTLDFYIGGTLSKANSTCSYVKIGNLVYIRAHYDSAVALTGQVTFVGSLPFAAADNSSISCGGDFRGADANTRSLNPTLTVPVGSATVYTTLTNESNSYTANDWNWTTGRTQPRVIISGCYLTS